MGVFQLGDYTLQNLNQGWRISWQVGLTRHILDMDVNQLIKQHIEGHLAKISQLLWYFDRSPDAFLNTEDGNMIIMQMPQSDTIPGEHMEGQKLTDWHHEQVIKGYNGLYGTNFTLGMVRSYDKSFGTV